MPSPGAVRASFSNEGALLQVKSASDTGLIGLAPSRRHQGLLDGLCAEGSALQRWPGPIALSLRATTGCTILATLAQCNLPLPSCTWQTRLTNWTAKTTHTAICCQGPCCNRASSCKFVGMRGSQEALRANGPRLMVIRGCAFGRYRLFLCWLAPAKNSGGGSPSSPNERCLADPAWHKPANPATSGNHLFSPIARLVPPSG